MAGNDNGPGQILNRLDNLIAAVNALNITIGQVFPQGLGIATTAGGASGKYMIVTGTDGVSYKIALLT